MRRNTAPEIKHPTGTGPGPADRRNEDALSKKRPEGLVPDTDLATDLIVCSFTIGRTRARLPRFGASLC